MGRLKLNFVGPVNFVCNIQVRVTDINYGGHLGNDRLLGILHEARIQWLRSLGYPSELEIDNMGWIQADWQVQYKSEAFLGDDLRVELSVQDLHKRGFELQHRVTCDDRLIAIGTCNLLFINYETRALSSVPEPFLLKLEAAKE